MKLSLEIRPFYETFMLQKFGTTQYHNNNINYSIITYVIAGSTDYAETSNSECFEICSLHDDSVYSIYP